MVVLALPRLVAGRDLATSMVSALGDISATEVVVDARAMVSGTGSFAAQLVRDILCIGEATKLVVVGAPGDFDTYIKEGAGKLGVVDRIDLQRHMPTDETPRKPYPAEFYPGCPCFKCDEPTWPKIPGSEMRMRIRMSLCPNCGNKRCPGAADHTLPCSGSNEPGQEGSLYPA